MKTKILTMLRASDTYVSGQDLCEQLGVSRTAVWKNINQLKKDGYDIEAVPNRGYRIVGTPDVITENEIQSILGRLDLKALGGQVYYKDEVNSTNTYAKQLAEEGAVSGTLVVADMQTAGRGRRGRAWCSPKGSSIYMTLLLRPDLDPTRASMLTLVMGLSVVQALKEKLEVTAQIKWPNDIVINGKKVCGILTEMSAQIDYINYLVIGVGINVNNQSLSEEVREMATSLSMQIGKQVKRAELIAEIMKQFQKNYDLFMQEQDLSGLMEQYNQVLINCNQQIKVLEPKQEYTGIARGINHLGELIVEMPDGEMRQVFAGEVSVRGLYGYV